MSVEISPENYMRRLWHTNCPNSPSGVMLYVTPEVVKAHDDGSKLYLVECLHCGVRGYIGLDKIRCIIVRDAEDTKPQAVQSPRVDATVAALSGALGEAIRQERER